MLLIVALALLPSVGCDRDDGASVEVEVGRDRNAAERLGDDLERGADRTGDALRRAGDDVRDSVQDP